MRSQLSRMVNPKGLTTTLLTRCDRGKPQGCLEPAKTVLKGKATCLRKRADSSSGSAQQVKACWAHGDAWLTQRGSRYIVNPKGLTTTLLTHCDRGKPQGCLEPAKTVERETLEVSRAGAKSTRPLSDHLLWRASKPPRLVIA
jgi:hypothetical protein